MCVCGCLFVCLLVGLFVCLVGWLVCFSFASFQDRLSALGVVLKRSQRGQHFFVFLFFVLGGGGCREPHVSETHLGPKR